LSRDLKEDCRKEKIFKKYLAERKKFSTFAAPKRRSRSREIEREKGDTFSLIVWIKEESPRGAGSTGRCCEEFGLGLRYRTFIEKNDKQKSSR